MRVLIFQAYYEPESAASLYLCTNLYEDLAERGFEVYLYAPLPTRGVSKEVRDIYRNRRLELKKQGNLRIHRMYVPTEPKSSFLRALRYLWMDTIYILVALRFHTDLLLLQSTPPTHGAMGAFLRVIRNIPFVYDLQDIFPDSLVNTGLTYKGSVIFRIGKMLERFTYRHTDKIIVISEDFKQNIMAKGVPEEKIELVYNWVDENEVVPIDRKENKLIARYHLDPDKFYVTHCGNIGLSQNMDMLAEVAKELEQYSDIRILLIGDGAYKSDLERIIKDRDVTNILILPFQPYEDIAHVFSLGDVGLVISKANVGQNSVPSKTWSIMSAQRPVLASFDKESELNMIINKAQCGICVRADDKNALKNAILELYNHRDLNSVMGQNGRNFILQNLTRKVGTGKIIDLIEKVINEERKVKNPSSFEAMERNSS